MSKDCFSETCLVISSAYLCAYLRSIINVYHHKTNNLSSSEQHVPNVPYGLNPTLFPQVLRQENKWQLSSTLRRLWAERGERFINQWPEGSVTWHFDTSAGCRAENRRYCLSWLHKWEKALCCRIPNVFCGCRVIYSFYETSRRCCSCYKGNDCRLGLTLRRKSQGNVNWGKISRKQ